MTARVIPHGKIADVLADPRVELDQDDWVCVPYDDLHDLRYPPPKEDGRGTEFVLRAVRGALSDRGLRIEERDAIVAAVKEDLLVLVEGQTCPQCGSHEIECRGHYHECTACGARTDEEHPAESA